MLATVAIETAHTFQPVREAFWLDEDWRRNNLRYYPFYGRGFVQLTWLSNYQEAGTEIGIDLVDNPDLAMDPQYAADILAWFWATHGIGQIATAHDWAEVRRRVQGGDAGLSELVSHANCLLAL